TPAIAPLGVVTLFGDALGDEVFAAAGACDAAAAAVMSLLADTKRESNANRSNEALMTLINRLANGLLNTSSHMFTWRPAHHLALVRPPAATSIVTRLTA